MQKVITYIKETQAEMKNVTWPTRQQAILFTVLIVVVSLATAAYLGAFDWLFGKAFQTFL